MFSAELDALVAVSRMATWRPAMSPRQAADVAWALANARHWTPAGMGELEEAVLKVGVLGCVGVGVWAEHTLRIIYLLTHTHTHDPPTLTW